MPEISTPIFGAMTSITGPLTFVAFLVAAGLAYMSRNEKIVEALTTRFRLDRRSYFRLMIFGSLLLFALTVFALTPSMQTSDIKLYVLIGSALILIALLAGFAAWLVKDNPPDVKQSPSQTPPSKNNSCPGDPPDGKDSETPKEKGDDDVSRRENTETLIQHHERRLQILKERQAIQGINTDPAVLIEIERIKAELEKLRADLEEIKKPETKKVREENAEKIPAPQVLLMNFEDKFTIQELRKTYFLMDIEFDDLVGSNATKAEKAMALIEYARKREQLSKLFIVMQEINPGLEC